ncbi:NUDIX hydrolase [Gracilibacillus oryzae]|uniref:NUDIX hydrolase n=1 Tax=Gracilibacillus oryzae TaxID=1672701 RepID=A0A7C8GTQ8_9BACI|nr:NUDIX hydrolase [Gracilibacillus oryzae]KAB8134689.1 NUDIX hydrolase [Gracilibacillus oryzae]
MKRIVKVLAVRNDEVLLVRQWRPALNQTTVELPGGKTEQNELSYDTAKRELKEETGAIAAEFVDLGIYQYKNLEVQLFFTNKITAMQQQCLDDDEQITVEWYSLEEVMKRIWEWNDLRITLAVSIAVNRKLLGGIFNDC